MTDYVRHPTLVFLGAVAFCLTVWGLAIVGLVSVLRVIFR